MLGVALLHASPSVHAGDLYVYVDAAGVTHVADRAKDSRFVRYRPGDFERALEQSGVAHAGVTLRVDGRDRALPTPFDGLIAQAAERYAVPAALVRAVIAVESGFDPQATSRVGARGLMQLMPPTARALGVEDAYDPAQNIDGGTRYLGSLLRAFDDTALALAAYNAGPTRVRKLGRIPNIPETRAYVKKVMALRVRYASGS